MCCRYTLELPHIGHSIVYLQHMLLELRKKTVIWSFSELFIYFFFRPPDHKSDKISRKSTNEIILALACLFMCLMPPFMVAWVGPFM